MVIWQEHIEFNCEILFGKPVITGTRIPVYLIFEKMALGYTSEDLIKAYPHLSTADITACMLYAAETSRFSVPTFKK